LEKSLQAREIGKSLEARLAFAGSDPALLEAKPHQDALRELLNVSQLEIITEGEQAIRISVTKAAGEKCERCWHWETDLGSHPDHPTICGRCARVLVTERET
jgi:isoleucyl-tRNA synthetase